MGWLYMHRSKGQTDKEFFEDRWGKGNYKILETGRHRGTIYMAVEVEPEGYTIGMAVLYKQVPSDPHHNFGYKTVDEFCGPVSSSCPTKILKMLTPLDEIQKVAKLSDNQIEWAGEWRKQSQEFRDRLANLPKVKTGMKLRFAEPITLTNGATVQEFTYLKNNRATYTSGSGYTGTMRLRRGWKEQYDFTVVT